MDSKIKDFIIESNKIESVGEEGYNDSLKAFNYIMQVSKPLTEKHILKTHKLLMKNLYPEIAGKFRECSVSVGGRVCPDFTEIPARLKRFLENINASYQDLTGIQKENLTKSMHITFENIHPFIDGNGRVGRLILNWHRKQLGLPILIIEYNKRFDYYNWFL